MRIGFLVIKNLLRGGGIERFTYEVGSRLSARGHEVVVFCMGHYGEVRSFGGMRAIAVPCIAGAASERLSASLVAMVAALRKRSEFDILHLHTPMTGAFGVLAKLFGVPTVVQMHGVKHKKTNILYWLWK